MWSLDVPYAPRPDPLLAGTPWRGLAVLALGLALAALGTAAGWLPRVALGVVTVAAGHGALLVTALSWSAPGRPFRAALVVPLLALAAGATAIHRAGAALYLAPLLAVGCWRRERPRREPLTVAAIALGALVGVLLGAHLLVSAARTLGHRPRLDAPSFVSALAYDAGANVLAAECFFRGALFDRLQRRWSLAGAAVLSTAACLVRYLVDPLLPRAPEIVTGALFYLALLSCANCWLYWRSGSIAPGLVAGLFFFAAYRLLGVW